MKTRIFPDLTGKKWAEVNLDQLAQRDFSGAENPLLDPQKCNEWVLDIARRAAVDFTYGGYLEDRAFLWRGHYLPPGPQAHLGVDYNVPDGTRVALCASGEVTHIIHQGIFGGWGGLLVFKLDQPPVAGADYLYYGHLAWDDKVKVGQKINAGETVGFIGKPKENGVWFPHLHVQLVSQKQMQLAGHQPDQVDGYMPPPVPTEDFPDPRPLIAL